MFREITWTCYLRVTSREKAARVLTRLSEALGVPLIVIECERYWKDNALFRATITSPLQADTIATAIFTVLHIGPPR